MSLLGTFNTNANPERGVRAQGAQEIELETMRPGTSSGQRGIGLARTTSLSSAETAMEYPSEDEIGYESAVEGEITRLARDMTRNSTRISTDGRVENPFSETKEDPTLDPHSPDFKPKNWMKNLLAISSRDPERYPQRVAGISFRNLSVHGFGSPTDYQKDVANSVLEIGSLVRSMMGHGKQKIQILRNFDGLVKTGEMLVVLGRPGRYVMSDMEHSMPID